MAHRKTTARKARNTQRLVHAQTLLPDEVREEILCFARELDPHRPNFSTAFRRVAVEWFEKRKAS